MFGCLITLLTAMLLAAGSTPDIAASIAALADGSLGFTYEVRDGVTGFLCDPDDADAMADAALTLLGDPARHAAAAAAARADVLERFQLEPTVAHYEALYRSVIAT